MTPLLAVLLLLSEIDPQPYSIGALATVEGSKATVVRLLDAAGAGNDVAFDKIARGFVIMLAPDFGVTVSRAKFAKYLIGCSDRRVVDAQPFPQTPKARAVRVTMQCSDVKTGRRRSMRADVMADDEHAFAFFPGGVSNVWPNAKR